MSAVFLGEAAAVLILFQLFLKELSVVLKVSSGPEKKTKCAAEDIHYTSVNIIHTECAACCGKQLE